MRAAAAAVLAIAACGTAAADYPRIARLDSRDPTFRQLEEDVQAYHLAAARGDRRLEPPLTLFSYDRSREDLFALSARLSLPYDTVATANGLTDPEDFAELTSIVLPNMPGLFVPDEAASDFEDVLVASSLGRRSGGLRVRVRGSSGERRFTFFPGERFNPVERAFFLRILFRFPLGAHGRLTSLYGPRASPFTGHPEFHDGIDIAAPEGTAVVAARDGTVAGIGRDELLGNFIRLSHPGGYETVYGHLSQALVSLNQEVHSGMMIGRVGTTGRSTGPHLHFEIRRKGSLRDPLPLIRIDQR